MSLTVRLGAALHRYGTPSQHLEEALTAVSRRFGLDGQFFSLPTSIHVAFGQPGEQVVFLVRAQPGAENLERLALLDALLDGLATGSFDIAQAERELDRVLALPPRYKDSTTAIAFGVASACAARFFGGGLAEVAAALLIGLASGVIAWLAGRRPALGPLQDASSAAVGAFVAAAFAAWIAPVSVPVATLAGLIVLVPGLMLTTAMTELATRHLASGSARLTGAFALFLAIGFGTALGWEVAAAAFGPRLPVQPEPLPPWTLAAALAASAVAFGVILRAAPRDFPVILAAAVLAFSSGRLGAMLLGPELGAMLGACAIGAAANLYSRHRRRPATVPFVPGILVLVPGSLGFLSLAALLDHDVLGGLETAFRMAVVAMALVTGALIANALVPPRRPL